MKTGFKLAGPFIIDEESKKQIELKLKVIRAFERVSAVSRCSIRHHSLGEARLLLHRVESRHAFG